MCPAAQERAQSRGEQVILNPGRREDTVVGGWVNPGWSGMAHDSTVMAAVSLTAVAIAVATLYLRRRRRKFLTLPSTLGDKNGGAIVVRVAQVSDREEVASSIADQTGTGSGTGNDDFLLQEFNRMVNDDNFLLLFAEDAETAKGLGMMAVVWSSSTETYWQSLRVSEAARGRGIASRLFDVAAHMALQRQGAESVARWGVVSSNEIMTRWSTRLGLAGPQHFRRYGADATAEPPRLPAGYTQRGATEDDVPMIMAFLATAPVGHSEYGTQNFVMAGWASFSEELLRAAVAGEASRGIPVPPPRLLLDASGALVAFVHAAILQFGERRFFMFRYALLAPEESLEPSVAYPPSMTFSGTPTAPRSLSSCCCTACRTSRTSTSASPAAATSPCYRGSSTSSKRRPRSSA